MTSDEFDDGEPSAQELAEAAALARALEPRASDTPADDAATTGPAVTQDALADALAAAALLRHVRGVGTETTAATPERARLAAAAARALPALAARRPRRWRWIISAALVPAAAMVVLGGLTMSRRAGPPPLALPAPDVALLQTQARVAGGHEGLAALDRQMRGYRSAFYAALATHEAGAGGGR